MRKLLGVAFLVLLTAPFAFGQCSDTDKQKLEAFDRAWGDAGQKGDQAFLQNVYADDYMNMTPAGGFNRTRAIENAVRGAERNKANPNPDRISHDYYIITCGPNTATITHRNVIVARVNGKDEKFYSRGVHFLEKRGNDWRVVSDAGGPLSDEGQILYMEREWNDADKKHDIAWFERNYDDDASDISSRNGAIHSKAEVLASIKTDKAVMDSMELSDMNVRVEGNTAVVTGINHVTGRDDKGVAFDRRVRFTDTLVKRDGRWLVMATQGTLIQ
ncbi:MAG: nuclear transport factor 2 family protein [Blastocatellia bacterium]|nr:nuclear transport factor 2 family protein [Blastocatellia bacterium]